MSNVFAVDTARIAAASGDIQRISAQIESDVAAMMARLRALDDCWRGEAAAGFADVTTSWSATQVAVQTSLAQISVALQGAGVDYETVEHQNRLRFTPV